MSGQSVGSYTDFPGQPVVGASWEAFVIENLIHAAPAVTMPGFYRTSGGAEVDLLLELPGGKRWAIEVNRSRIAARRLNNHLDALRSPDGQASVSHYLGGLDQFPPLHDFITD